MIGTSAPHRHGCFRAASGAGQMDSKKMRKTHVSTRSAAAITANRLACSAFPECNASFFIFRPTFVKVYISVISISTKYFQCMRLPLLGDSIVSKHSLLVGREEG
jgi:hypothetical protein